MVVVESVVVVVGSIVVVVGSFGVVVGSVVVVLGSIVVVVASEITKKIIVEIPIKYCYSYERFLNFSCLSVVYQIIQVTFSICLFFLKIRGTFV